MSKIKILNKGDVLRTELNGEYWGLAVVLSEQDASIEKYPSCHIAITPVIYQHKFEFSEVNIQELKPLDFKRKYALRGQEEFYKTEICIGVYKRKSKFLPEVIGSIDPLMVYNGPLPYRPLSGLEVTWPIYGEISGPIGGVALTAWKRLNDI